MLERYKKILDGKAKAKFLIAKEKGILDKRTKQVEKILESCEFCERRCGVNRKNGEKGFCKAPDEWRIFGANAHMGEESVLIPSGTIFLAGCTMRCCYCQNAPASVTPGMGEVWTNKEVAEWTDRMRRQGCINVNFVTPDCYVHKILQALKLVKENIPVVWNSNSYYSEKIANIIKDIVDVYLLDFRYFKEECGKRLSSAPNYPEVAKRNHLLAKKYGELIIRVLVMPGHLECDAKPILKWIKENLGKDVYVNILAQYHPCNKAWDYPEINRPLSMEEYKEVVDFAKRIGLGVF